MVEELISQIMPYLQYFLIVGAVIGGIVGGVKLIYRRGIIRGVDTVRGEAIQREIKDVKKELKEEKIDTDSSHRLFHKKIDENKCEIKSVGKDVATIKGKIEIIMNFILNGKKEKSK